MLTATTLPTGEQMRAQVRAVVHELPGCHELLPEIHVLHHEIPKLRPALTPVPVGTAAQVYLDLVEAILRLFYRLKRSCGHLLAGGQVVPRLYAAALQHTDVAELLDSHISLRRCAHQMAGVY